MSHFRQSILLGSLLLISYSAFAQQLQHINPTSLPVSKNYSQVVVTQGGRTVYISGQMSVNAAGEIIGKGDFRAQTRQVFENLKTTLSGLGASFRDVIKMTTYVVNPDAEKTGIVREIRGQYNASSTPPASTYIGIQGLYDKDLLIEIDLVVALK